MIRTSKNMTIDDNTFEPIMWLNFGYSLEAAQDNTAKLGHDEAVNHMLAEIAIEARKMLEGND